MTNSEPDYSCQGCGAVRSRRDLEEVPPPCASCGDTRVLVGMHFTATVEAHAALKYDAFEAGKSRKKGRFAWGKSGRDWFHREGVWANVRRQFNKREDTYEEVITYADSGEVIREVKEPLSKHQGRGSAKTRLPSNEGG